jgi:hypothetical protein
MDILQRFKRAFYEKLNPQDQNELNLLISEINSPLS